MTDVKQLIGGRTIQQWQEFAREDDCLIRMVPSELRQILALARARVEALKQEPFIYLSRRGDDGSIYSIGHEVVEQSNIVCTPLYTAPVPQEKPVVKVPKADELYYQDAFELVRELNPHITFEVQEVKDE